MRLPIKITPDNLKHAIINVKFSTTYPLEFINGRVFELLKDDLKYVPSAPVNLSNQNIQGTPGIIQISNGVFVNDKIKLQVENSNLIFTNWDKYLGWGVYFDEVKNVLSKIHNSGLVASYHNIGIRYISEYVNETLFDKLKTDFRPDFSLENKDFNFKSTLFKSELIIGSKMGIINLADNLQRINANLNTIEQFSLIDIDIISPLNTTALEDLISAIDDSHNMEKEIFFGMLKQEFINKLQPTY